MGSESSGGGSSFIETGGNTNNGAMVTATDPFAAFEDSYSSSRAAAGRG